MLRAINDRFTQPVPSPRSDIFRKFQKQFRYLLQYPISIDDSQYVEQSTTYYDEAFDEFVNGLSSDVRFLVGYTGTGKSTFIRHYLGITNASPRMYNENTIVVPSVWNGIQLSDDKYQDEIAEHISRMFSSCLSIINQDQAKTFPLNDLEKMVEYIRATRADILANLTLQEKMMYVGQYDKECAAVLQKTADTRKIEYASSSLKYFIEEYASNIERIILVIDDVETLASDKLRTLVASYFHLYNCFHNTTPKKRLIVNLLISLRPHSYRYLKEKLPHEQFSSYGNYMLNNNYVIWRDKIPSIQKLFESRFEYAVRNTDTPGNRESWWVSKNALFNLVSKFDNQYVSMIQDLCHMNIRAIMDCFQMILSNRIWCQDARVITEYPSVSENEYDFNNIVNITRTLSCGESTMYSGKCRVQFNPNNFVDLQLAPTMDNSAAFIPNILVSPETRQCDVLLLYIMYFMEYKFSSGENTINNTEFITVRQIMDEINNLLCLDSTYDLLSAIHYLFQNRIVRKSIYDRDSEKELNVLTEDNYVYFTKKGSRLIQMLRADCVLLELYREDTLRAYSDDAYYKSSYELVNEKRRDLLFSDLITYANEIYQNEDEYIRRAIASPSRKAFIEAFSLYCISEIVISGIEKSLGRAQGLDNQDELLERLRSLKGSILERKEELINLGDE